MGLAIAAIVAGAAASAGGAYLSSKKKTKIPSWKSMDIGSEVNQAISSNETNFDRSAALTSKANTYNNEQIMAMLRKAIPGFDDKMGQAGKLLDSGLKGEIPADVQKQLQLRAASRSVAGGYAGSGMARNLEARDFGITSYGITQNTLRSVESWTRSMASMFTPGMTSITSSFISPETWLRQAQSDKENAWKVKMGQAIEDSQPSPGDMALASGLGTVSSAASMYAGYKFANPGTEKPANLSIWDMTPVNRNI